MLSIGEGLQKNEKLGMHYIRLGNATEDDEKENPDSFFEEF